MIPKRISVPTRKKLERHQRTITKQVLKNNISNICQFDLLLKKGDILFIIKLSAYLTKSQCDYEPHKSDYIRVLNII